MKICLVANPNSAHTRRSIEGLLERGYEVALIGETAPQHSVSEKVLYHDLSRRFNLKRLRFPIWSMIMPGLLRQIRPNIVHAIGASRATWLARATHFHPFVITATGSDLLLLEQRSALHKFLTRQAVLSADYLLCLGEHVKEAALKLGIPSEQVESTIFGVDTDIYYPPQDDLDQTIETNEKTSPVVLSLRAINAIYNPLTIAQAIPIVLQSVPTIRFWIMTYNANQQVFEQFKEIIQANEATDAVKYLPPMQDDERIAQILRQTDIAISVPSSDGTPVSVLESMACGNALVVSDLPSIHDWVVEGQSGYFVPARDVEALSKTIIRLAKDAPLRAELGQNAASFAREHASKKRQFDTLDRVYQKVHG